MTVVRLALGLAFSSAPEHRWRRVAVLVSTAVFMVLLLAAISTMSMAVRQNDRNAARLPGISSTIAPTDMFFRLGGDNWHGRPIALAWVEPTTSTHTPEVPPGMRTFPEPGQAVVSPALAELINTHPSLGARYPNHDVLDDEGVNSGGELLAYVRPSRGRAIGEEDAAVHKVGARWVGSGPVVRVSGFGGASGLGLADNTPFWAVSQAVTGFLIVPALIVLIVGASAASRLRDHRFQVLRSLGSPASHTRRIATVETLALAVPSFVGVTLAWAVVAPHVNVVPLVNYRLVRGDAAIPWWLLLTAAVIAMGVCVLVSVALSAVRGSGRASRPTTTKTTASSWAVLPMMLAGIAFVAARGFGGELASELNAVGVLLAVSGSPLLLPGLLAGAGASFSRFRSVPFSLTGSTLQWDPLRMARPFMGLGALLMLALVGAGYTSLAAYTEEPNPGVATSFVTVEWHAPRSGDTRRFDNALETGLVIPFEAPKDHHDVILDNRAGEPDHKEAGGAASHDAHRSVLVGATCTQIAASVLPGITCSASSLRHLPPGAEPRLKALLGVESDMSVHLAARSDVRPGSAVVVGSTPVETLDERTRNAALATLPAPFVNSSINLRSQPSPLVAWIAAGSSTAIVALSIACLLALVDRLLATRRQHRRLVNIGMPPSTLRLFAALLFALPYLVMVAFAFTTGLAICLTMVSGSAPVPWVAIGATLMTTVTLGLIGTFALATASTRSAIRAPE